MLSEAGRVGAPPANPGTPLVTRVVLVCVLALTVVLDAALMGGRIDAGNASAVAPLLWLYTGLFVLRVAGQVLVALRPQSWLPPMVEWNLLPYVILLPTQLVLIMLMVWIDVVFTTGDPMRHPALGQGLVVFSALYAAAMPIRYVIRMARRPDQRWFGGTIPMVFHVVLASYLYVLGRFHGAG